MNSLNIPEVKTSRKVRTYRNSCTKKRAPEELLICSNLVKILI